MTVTSFMMINAFSLDSDMPLVFSHQKYKVTTIAKVAAIKSIVVPESGPLMWKYCKSSVISPARYCPAATPLMGPGQDVVEHQGGDAEFRQRSSQGLLDCAVDSAAHEHAAALHVHRADGVGEQHDAQDEPRRGLADVTFRLAARVVRGRSQVVQDDCGSFPEGNEAE